METREHLRREAWNKGKLVGQRAPLKPKDIWVIRIHLQNAHAVRVPRYDQPSDQQQAPSLRPSRPAGARRDPRKPVALTHNGCTAENAEARAVRILHARPWRPGLRKRDRSRKTSSFPPGCAGPRTSPRGSTRGSSNNKSCWLVLIRPPTSRTLCGARKRPWSSGERKTSAPAGTLGT